MRCPCAHLQRNHVWFVLLPDAQVIHEELQHVKGLLLAHVQQQHAGYKTDTLTVTDLDGGTRTGYVAPMTTALSTTLIFLQ